MRDSLRSWKGHAVAVATVGVVFVFRHYVLRTVLGDDAPMLLFLGPIILAARVGGFWPGVLATALSTFVSAYFFLPPYFSFAVERLSDQVRIPLFLVLGILISWLSQALLTATRRAERHAAELIESHQHLERRVAERTAEVAERNQQLRRLASELSAAEQRERRRIALTLHDHLQQILVAAKYGIDHLRKAALGERQQALVEQVDSLIAESIEASRTLTVELSPPVLYDRGLAAALEWLQRHYREKYAFHVDVQCENGAEPPDPNVQAFLFQAVRELLFNVVKHSGTRRALVRMRRNDQAQVEITVEDQGAGCDPDRLTAPAERAGGYGLFGIQQRLELLGGQFRADTSLGEGCRVMLVAPADPPITAEASQARGHIRPVNTNQPQTRGGAPVSRRIRVLIADDHRVVREGLAGLLRMQDAIEVVGEAENGRVAVELARQLQPDVVVMDVSMPVMDGTDATRSIVQDSPAIRVIGLSMHERQDMAEAMLGAGAVAYLSKGGPSEALVEAIRG